MTPGNFSQIETSEMDRASATLSERVAEVERVMQTRSASPTTTVDKNPALHEDIARLESRIQAGIQAFSREVNVLREEVLQSISGQDKNLKEWTRGKLTHMNTKLRGLREFATAVETLFIRSVPLRRASAPESSPGVEVRSLLSTEVMEEVDGRLAVTDVDPNGQRFVKFWIDDFAGSPREEQSAHHAAEEHAAVRDPQHFPVSNHCRILRFLSLANGMQNLGCHAHLKGERGGSGITPRITPEDHMPKGCSLLSMEPLREWFCTGADMTSSAEYEAALRQIEHDHPDIRQYNDNILEERWAHFSLEGVKFPTAMVDERGKER